MQRGADGGDELVDLFAASIDDPSGRLETSGEVMAHAKRCTPEDVDDALFADWLRQARELELAAARRIPCDASERSGARRRRDRGARACPD